MTDSPLPKHFMRRIFLFLAVTLSLSRCFYDVHSPKVNKEVLPELSEEADIVSKQTDIFVDKLEMNGGLMADPWADKLFQEIVDKLPFPDNTEKPKIKLIRNPSANAFALYNGTIYVHSGLISKLTHPDQLAFIIAHESIHWSKKHTLLQYHGNSNTLLLAQVFDTLITPITSRFYLRNITEGGIGMLTLAAVAGYGRELEEEADQLGFQMLEQGGFDRRRSLDVFIIFNRLISRYSGEPDSYLLLSHPANSERYETIVALLKIQPSEPANIQAIDSNFIKESLHIRLLNAAWCRRAGRNFEALEDLGIIEENLKNIDPPTLEEIQNEKKANYRMMLRDFDRVKSSISPSYWSKLHSDRSDSEVKAEWLTKAQIKIDGLDNQGGAH